MESVFRLAQLIKDHDPSRRSKLGSFSKHGLFIEIEKWSKKQPDLVNLERHISSRLYNNDASVKLSLPMLNTLCAFLIAKCKVPEHTLPQSLFGAKEHHILDLISNTGRMQFVVGKRSSKAWGGNAYIMATDAALQSKLIKIVSESLSSRGSAQLEVSGSILIDAPPSTIRQSTKTAEWRKILELTRKHYETLCTEKNITVVAAGSTKVNGFVEHILASIFNLDAHITPTRTKKLYVPPVPIYFRYRDTDPQPRSCCGGKQIAKGVDSELAGIYYYSEGGDWVNLPSNNQQEVAFFAYVKRPGTENQLFVACGGFSSSGTQCLTQSLQDKNMIRQLWPPQVDEKESIVGIFLVRFDINKTTSGSQGDESVYPTILKYDVIPLPTKVVTDRIDYSCNHPQKLDH